MNSKYGLHFPNISYKILLNQFVYPRVIDFFYKQNMYGYSNDDIEKGKNISILEFDLNDPPEPPFADTSPEELEKELLKDYMIPLVSISERKLISEIEDSYNEKVDYGDSAILNLKDDYLSKVSELLAKTKESKHFTPGLKKPIIDSLNRVIKYIELNVNTTFADDYSEYKIKVNLSLKELCLLMLYFNEKNLFDKKYGKTEIANLIELHFENRVGKKNEYKSITNAKTTISNSLNSEPHASVSDDLKKMLVDFDKIIKQIPKG